MQGTRGCTNRPTSRTPAATSAGSTPAVTPTACSRPPRTPRAEGPRPSPPDLPRHRRRRGSGAAARSLSADGLGVRDDEVVVPVEAERVVGPLPVHRGLAGGVAALVGVDGARAPDVGDAGDARPAGQRLLQRGF